MTDRYRMGGKVAPEVVLVLDRHYRISRQQMTAYGTAAGFPRWDYLGIVTLATAEATMDDLSGMLRTRELMWLESARIGSEAFSRVLT
jgi:hypothetical protein